MAERIRRIENFPYGTVDAAEEKSIPPGSASRSMNWLTMGDKIELRRGQQRVGGDDGAGKVTGLHVAFRDDDEPVLLKTYARKLKYYDTYNGNNVWTEIGSDLLPATANNEDQAFGNIKTLAGAQAWMSSPNGLLLKLMINHGDSQVAPSGKDNYDSTKNHKGRIKIKLNRMLLFGKLTDKSGLRGSWIDNRQYTTVTNEILGAGNAVQKTFSGTLAAISGKRTCFALVVDAVVVGGATESFTDNRDGTLSSNLGGTGTINYSTGAFSITFNTAPDTAQNVLGDYQWEDSTNQGLADFSESSPRVAGEGFYLPQGDGGELMNVESFKDIEYCLHRFKTWFVALTDDDTQVQNRIFRELAGLPHPWASVATGEGIYYIDDRDEGDIRCRLLTFDPANAEVVPVTVSANIDLNNYRFDKCAVIQAGDLILFACRTLDSLDSNDVGVNNRVLILNKGVKRIGNKIIRLNAWDVTDLYVSRFQVFNGNVVGGHSLKNNVYELLSGWDDDNNEIANNYWESNLDEMQIAELKKARTIRVEGEIVPDQVLEVHLSVDNGGFIKIGEILGTGAYVDIGSGVSIGASLYGAQPIGGLGEQDAVTAYHYFRELPMRRYVSKFQKAKIKFVATGIGYVSVSSYEFFDITTHGTKIPSKYDV